MLKRSPMRLCVGLVVPFLALGCSKDTAPPIPDATPKGRSEAVVATGPQVTVKTTAHAVAPRAPRKLCDSAPAGAGRSIPNVKVDHLEAAGSPSLGDRLPGGGKWSWVNLWAAWCGPCKEEIPRLRAWEAKLAQAGTPINMVFVSLDDDERQARKFLDAQPPGGLRSSFWLQEGKSRSGWLADVKMKAEPQLPQQLLFDATGALRCVIDGAIDDVDFPQIQAIVAKR